MRGPIPAAALARRGLKAELEKASSSCCFWAAGKLLKQLIKVAPDPKWAKRALSNLEKAKHWPFQMYVDDAENAENLCVDEAGYAKLVDLGHARELTLTLTLTPTPTLTLTLTRLC